MTPREADTEEKICSLKRDNIDAGNFGFLIQDDYVVFVTFDRNTNVGTNIQVPRKEFNRIVDWYQADQAVR